MTYQEMLEAQNDAQRTIRNGDRAIKVLAELMVGRLRLAEVDRGVCEKLKRELKDFNMQTLQWKSETRRKK